MKIRISAVLLAAVMLLTGCWGKKDKTEKPGEKELAVTFLNVGKGDCILIQTGGKNVLIDTGYDKTANGVIGFLKDNNASSIDTLIITHYDRDHVGGAAAIVRELEVGELLVPAEDGHSQEFTAFIDEVKAKSLTMENVREDKTIALGDATLTVFASRIVYEKKSGGEWNDNDVSLVSELRYGEDSYLFSADIEKAGIKSFLAAHKGQYDVIKMPHHGRWIKSVGDLLEQTDPEYAVITDGIEEPADTETLTELKELGSLCYRSSKHGVIRISSSGTGEYHVQTNI